MQNIRATKFHKKLQVPFLYYIIIIDLMQKYQIAILIQITEIVILLESIIYYIKIYKFIYFMLKYQHDKVLLN